MEYVVKDADFRNRFKEEGFLCVPHFKMCVQNCRNKDALLIITDVMLDRIKSIAYHLAEIKCKSDYRFSNEYRSPEEKIAWIQAAGFVAGDKDQ